MAFTTNEEDEVMSEMNVTPLVDVMLVLLVIFIVTAPILTNAVNVTLPKTDSVAPPDSKKPLIVSVTKDGQYEIDQQQVTLDVLKARLKTVHSQTPDRPAQLAADEGVPYGRVAKAMAALEKSGIQKIAVLTSP